MVFKDFPGQKVAGTKGWAHLSRLIYLYNITHQDTVSIVQKCCSELHWVIHEKNKTRKHKKMVKQITSWKQKLKFWREPSCSPTILPNYSQHCRINKISNKIQIVPLHLLNFRKEDPCSISCGVRWFVLEISGRACLLCLFLDWQLIGDLKAEFLLNTPLEIKWLRCFGKISNYPRLNQDKQGKHHLGLSSKCWCCHWEHLEVAWLGDKHF